MCVFVLFSVSHERQRRVFAARRKRARSGLTTVQCIAANGITSDHFASLIDRNLGVSVAGTLCCIVLQRMFRGNMYTIGLELFLLHFFLQNKFYLIHWNSGDEKYFCEV